MRKIERIFVHCSATRPSQNIGVETIRRWHMLDRGWSDVGYHVVIRRNGVTESGRPIERAGAHTRGHNSDSLGVCLVGGVNEQTGAPEFNYTRAQMEALRNLIGDWQSRFQIPDFRVYGHNSVAVKACPCFNVAAWMSVDASDTLPAADPDDAEGFA